MYIVRYWENREYHTSWYDDKQLDDAKSHVAALKRHSNRFRDIQLYACQLVDDV